MRQMITAMGETHTIREWSRRVGINEATIATRLKSGWSVNRALSEPPRKMSKPFVPHDAPPAPRCDVDPDAWLMQVWNDPRRCGRMFEIAFAIHLAVKRGDWPRSFSDLSRDTGMERRTIQRLIPALEHCGHLRRSYACACRVDLILILKDAPGEPALLAAE